MKVTLKPTISVVRPAKDTPKKSLWVSDLDLLVPCTHIQTVYFYQHQPGGGDGSSSGNFFDAEVLKEALADVLVPFYPMAGRLGRDENGRVEVHCNGGGVHFMEAESDCSMEEFGGFTPRKEMVELVPKVDYSGDISSYPLLLVQVTAFKCGGVSLGVALHHTLADGTSAIHLINSWSEVARGVPFGTAPFIDRTLLRPRDPPAPTLVHSEYDPPPPMLNALNGPQKLQSTPNATTTRIVKITLDQVNALKAAARAGEPASRPSTYKALTAHIWRCMCRARGLDDDQPTRLYIATDGRSRLSPPLPGGFFGNVLFTATVTSSAGQIRSNGLSTIMGRIDSALGRMDGEYASSALDFLALQPDLTALRRGAHTFKCPNLNIVSWIRLPIHGADFGWGRPVFMGPAKVIFEGMAYILPGPSGDGDLDVILCLEAPHMQIFEKCFYDI